MKKAILSTVALALAVTALLSIAAPVLATGNGAPNGQHYNLNLIAAPNQKNDNFDGGNGARIFVKDSGSTFFYVHAGDSYQVLDRDGTDGKVGWGIANPGIVFPYNTETGQWQVEIYLRVLGPKGSSVDWSTYVPSFLADKPSFTDEYGQTWYLYTSFHLDRDTKFSMKTSSLLIDGYQDLLWQFDPSESFKICQMRIYLQ